MDGMYANINEKSRDGRNSRCGYLITEANLLL